MDLPFPGCVLDPSKCCKLSTEEKKHLFLELSRSPETAPQKVQTWSRMDLLDILGAVTGKERKQTSLTKQKLMEQIFKIVSVKKPVVHMVDLEAETEAQTETPSKRQRNSYRPSSLVFQEKHTSPLVIQKKITSPLGLEKKTPSPLPFATVNLPPRSEAKRNIRYCINLSCKASLSQEDVFCKRCSCCICKRFDANKDPSMWLVCSSEAPSEIDACGRSCHLDCAFKHERAGISDGHCPSLDGSYHCVHCGKLNDLLGCWRKQLIIAKDARRVDLLCFRLVVSHKLLSSTKKYQSLHEIVDAALKKLESEVGPLVGLTSMARGLVSRLSVGAEVQKLCAHAVDSLDLMRPSVNSTTTSFIKFEDISPTSVTVVLGSEDDISLPPGLVGFALWHRNAEMVGYPTVATQKFLKGTQRVLIEALNPGTEYVIKVVAFDNTRELSKWEVGVKTQTILEYVRRKIVNKTSPEPLQTTNSWLSNPSSDGEESNNTGAFRDPYTVTDRVACRPETTSLEKPGKRACKEETSGFQNARTGTATRMKVTRHEETPGHSGSALDEQPSSTPPSKCNKDSINSVEHNQVLDVLKSDNESNTPLTNVGVLVPNVISESARPVNTSWLETGKERLVRKDEPGKHSLENGTVGLQREPGSSSKKITGSKHGEHSIKDGSLEGAYEYSIQVIRQLECDGHLETSFRVQFLTWFSLRSTPREKRVVNVFVETLADDPASLAAQLVDTFSEAVNRKRPHPVPTGICMSAWH